jgi:ribosomal protein S18 acetylase RimI-like enzyme
MSKHHYTVAVESYKTTYEELKHLYKQCYEELALAAKDDGRLYPEYNPWLDSYNSTDEAGALILYVAREQGRAVGYCLMYLTQDTRTQKLVTYEDSLYMLPEHRNGIGMSLGRIIVRDMQSRGVTRIFLSAINGRVVNMWKRIGFKPIATTMELEL